MKNKIKCVGDRIYPDMLKKWTPLQLYDYGFEVLFVPKRMYWIWFIKNTVGYIWSAFFSHIQGLRRFRKEFNESFNRAYTTDDWMILQHNGEVLRWEIIKEQRKFGLRNKK